MDLVSPGSWETAQRARAQLHRKQCRRGLACFPEKIYNSASKPKYHSSEDKKNGLYNNLSW